MTSLYELFRLLGEYANDELALNDGDERRNVNDVGVGIDEVDHFRVIRRC